LEYGLSSKNEEGKMGFVDLRGRTLPAYSVDPKLLVLISDPNHPLYDERVDAPTDDAMVASIKRFGVVEPIIVRKNGEALEVVDGRQRVKNAIEANRQLKEEGKYLIKVPVVFYRGGDGADLVGTAITLNEVRRPDAVLIKAAKARRMLQVGATLAEVAMAFGVVPATIENWIRLDGLTSNVKRLVAKGDVPYTAAMRLARLPREKQDDAAKKILTRPTNANAIRAVQGGRLECVQPPTRQVLGQVAEVFLKEKDFLENDAASDVFSAIEWVLGRISTEELLDVLTTKAGLKLAKAVRSVVPGEPRGKSKRG
jgi:ParB family transcriptional regulator, chromosome partitioning protein